MTRALSLAASITWAIEESWLRQILAIANREGAGPEAVEQQLGRPLDNDAAEAVTMHGDVAVIGVVGPIMRYASIFTRVSAMSSIETIARDFHAAMTDPSVRAVVLRVDSPGGEIAGVAELGDMIYAMRGTKPCIAYVGDLAASAGYWLASAADEIVCGETAQLGSIGVVAGVPNPDAKAADEIEIVSSQSPEKRPDVTTKEGRQSIQDRVDALADVFIGKVARNRGLDAKMVESSFGRGGMRVGADAVKNGMADRLGSFEGVLASLGARDADEDGDDDGPDSDRGGGGEPYTWMRASAGTGPKAAAVSYENAPIVDEPWDGSAAEGRLRKWASKDGSAAAESMDWAKYRRGFAWFDSKNAETFGAYKLPHHDVKDGKLVTVRKGVIAAGNAVQGSRGGVDIPSADVPGVKAHLKKHYEAMDMTPPWSASTKGQTNMALNEKIRSALGLSVDATDSELLAVADAISTQSKVLCTLTGEQSPDVALGVVRAWKGEAEKVPALSARISELETEKANGEVEKLFADAKAAKKITPAEEASFRGMLAAKDITVGGLRGLLSVKTPHANFVAPATKEPEATTVVGLKHEGRLYEEIPKVEIQSIEATNGELVARMRQDWMNRGRPAPAVKPS